MIVAHFVYSPATRAPLRVDFFEDGAAVSWKRALAEGFVIRPEDSAYTIGILAQVCLRIRELEPTSGNVVPLFTEAEVSLPPPGSDINQFSKAARR